MLAITLTNGRWQRPPHLKLLNQKLIDVAYGKCPRLLVTMPPRHGKALALDTPIPTPDGWSCIGDIEVGDFVFDERGKPTVVTGKSPVWKDRPVFRVKLDSGEELIADAEHDWMVRADRKYPNRRTRWTTEKLAGRTSPRRVMVDKHDGLDLPVRELPIDPYTLGVWLGDGSSTQASITAIGEDGAHIRQRIAEAFKTSDRATADTFGVLGLQVLLRRANLLGNKHVPACYLRASPGQRLSLLQGLIDTDGYVSPGGQIEFCSTEIALANGVRELVVSLGYKASLIKGRATLYGTDCGPKYRVLFYMPNAASLPRKAARCIEPRRSPNHYLTIEEAGRADTVCIEVAASSHQFLAGKGMAPTCNSEMCSHWFPVWYLSTFPEKRIILASYEANFAASWGMRVRDSLRDAYERGLSDVTVRGDVSARGEWQLDGYDGGMYTAGVGGAVTGRGANVLLIDDPTKNAEEANSLTIREKQWDWYRSTAYSRLEPGGAVVIITTRWNKDDLPGRIIDQTDEHFEVINFPAIAEEEDELGRAVGEALWPERFPLERLLEIKDTIGGYWWAALYQQNPTVREGGLFRREWFEIVDKVPTEGIRYVRYWDRGATEKGDWTVGLLLGQQGRMFFVKHVRRFRGTPGVNAENILAQVRADGKDVRQRMEQEPGSSGVDTIDAYSRLLIGYNFKGDRVTGDKVMRAEGAAIAAEAGNLKLLRGEWNQAFLDEVDDFPHGMHDDQVDALSGAYAALTEPVRKKARIRLVEPVRL